MTKTILTPFDTLADGTTPFDQARDTGAALVRGGAPVGATLLGTFHVAFDLGGVRFNTTCDTLALAHEAIASMDGPAGYSSHSATISEWRARAVDGKPYLKPIYREWFGEPVVKDGKYLSDGVATYQPLLDSDGPDYDPQAFIAAVEA